MLRQALKNFMHLCRSNRLFLTLSSLCLVCAFVGFLFLQEKGYHMYTVIAGQQPESQQLNFACSDEGTVEKLYKELVNDTELPKMGIVTVFGEKYAGLYWDREWNQEVWYTPYGRFFSAGEMESGANAALLEMNYLRQLPADILDRIWETGIEINGTKLYAVGNYDHKAVYGVSEDTYGTDIMPASVMIPLKTYFDMGLYATRLLAVFSQPLTSTQIMHLNGLIQSFSNVSSFSLPKVNNVNAIQSYISATAQYALIFVLSLLSIVSIIVYWLKMEFSRYKIYMICGAKRRQIVFLLSMNIALLITLTYALAFLIILLLTKITPSGIVTMLPWGDYGVIYLGALVFSLLTVNIRAIPVVLGQKMLLK